MITFSIDPYYLRPLKNQCANCFQYTAFFFSVNYDKDNRKIIGLCNCSRAKPLITAKKSNGLPQNLRNFEKKKILCAIVYRTSTKQSSPPLDYKQDVRNTAVSYIIKERLVNISFEYN